VIGGLGDVWLAMMISNVYRIRMRWHPEWRAASRYERILAEGSNVGWRSRFSTSRYCLRLIGTWLEGTMLAMRRFFLPAPVILVDNLAYCGVVPRYKRWYGQRCELTAVVAEGVQGSEDTMRR
jgi:hypothetical protein